MSKITAAQWREQRRRETETLFEFVQREQAAEKRERGHDCGHQFTITVTCHGHYGTPEGHFDAEYDGADLPMTLTVRAHDLQAALLRAASHNLPDWSGLEEDDDTP